MSFFYSAVCSEVCANVIEVQLGEERAKIDLLKQQIQLFQVIIHFVKKNYASFYIILTFLRK